MIAELLPEIRERLPDVPVPPELDTEQQRFRLADSVASCLQRATARQPLLVVFDDLHWADAASLRLLQFLARDGRSAGWLTIGTFRDPELAPDAPASQR